MDLLFYLAIVLIVSLAIIALSLIFDENDTEDEIKTKELDETFVGFVQEKRAQQ